MDPNNQPTNNQIPNGVQVPAPPANIFVPPPTGQMPNTMIDPPQQPRKAPVGLIISAVVLGLFAVDMLVLTILFYGQMSDYKNNSDQKSAAAVEVAKKEQEKQLNAQFVEKEKEPLISYVAPSTAAGTTIVYPKTWSLYVVEGKSGAVVDAYFNPIAVTDVGNDANVYALRAQVLDKPYTTVVKEYEADAKKGTVQVAPYKPAVENAQEGVRLDGVVRDDVKGAMVIVPVRDKTIKLWTETDTYINDFNTFVLKNLQYSP